ncbi:hypothetical protein [Serratia sp. AKBS12]|uniref:hypothetical protein n=1 Tax=Serratia sp. AKBS12 TaxID=2974597 RepID=UPI0021650597|nr:hypothetical protein [Serratia sp. AKBS12]MCS3407093.1 hypothetical protein [Serratia sp. AKBS12]
MKIIKLGILALAMISSGVIAQSNLGPGVTATKNFTVNIPLTFTHDLTATNADPKPDGAKLATGTIVTSTPVNRVLVGFGETSSLTTGCDGAPHGGVMNACKKIYRVGAYTGSPDYMQLAIMEDGAGTITGWNNNFIYFDQDQPATNFKYSILKFGDYYPNPGTYRLVVSASMYSE